MNCSSRSRAGFTLVELMVSTAIIGLIMLVLVNMTNQTSQTWRSATEKIEKFQEARDGFESMTRRLSQATLNTNWDYLDKNGAPRSKNVNTAAFNSFVPVYYGRTSELRFISGPMTNATFPGVTPLSPDKVRPGHGIFFQAPFGVTSIKDNAALDNLLNTWGYFVEAGLDPNRPSFINAAQVPTRWRSRLMEFMQPAEKMSLYDQTDTTLKWFSVGLSDVNRPVRVLAENVLTLVILPRLSKSDEDARQKAGNSPVLAPEYFYDSTLSPVNPGGVGGTDPGMINPKNQLPPILMVTMVAVDERFAQRLAEKYPQSPLMGMDLASSKVSPAVSYSSLFTNATRLEDDPGTSTPDDGDLSDLERVLTHEGVTYRVFTTNVSIRGAKWSRVQTK